jgi:hypothetical protein
MEKRLPGALRDEAGALQDEASFSWICLTSAFPDRRGAAPVRLGRPYGHAASSDPAATEWGPGLSGTR